MAQSSQERIQQALKLEELQRNKAVIQFNQECDTEIAKVISAHTAHGVLRSGMTITKIMQAHVSRAGKIIDKAIELRKVSIQRVPELATGQHFASLLEHLERTADAICG